MNLFDFLPNEIVFDVCEGVVAPTFRDIDRHEILTLVLVCKRFHGIVTSPSFLRRVVRKRFINPSKRILKNPKLALYPHLFLTSKIVRDFYRDLTKVTLNDFHLASTQHFRPRSKSVKDIQRRSIAWTRMCLFRLLGRVATKGDGNLIRTPLGFCMRNPKTFRFGLDVLIPAELEYTNSFYPIVSKHFTSFGLFVDRYSFDAKRKEVSQEDLLEYKIENIYLAP